MDQGGAPFERPEHWRTPEEKLRLVLSSYQADNVADFCRQEGIDRSYLYALRREHETAALASWNDRKPGRPPRETEDARALRDELEKTQRELKAAREEAAKWEVRAEVQGLYARAYQEAAAKKKSQRPKGSK